MSVYDELNERDLRELRERHRELQKKYDELLAMTREAMGYLISLNGDLNYDRISNLVERFEQFTGEEC